jgi:hypothetical protein
VPRAARPAEGAVAEKPWVNSGLDLLSIEAALLAGAEFAARG